MKLNKNKKIKFILKLIMGGSLASKIVKTTVDWSQHKFSILTDDEKKSFAKNASELQCPVCTNKRPCPSYGFLGCLKCERFLCFDCLPRCFCPDCAERLRMQDPRDFTCNICKKQIAMEEHLLSTGCGGKYKVCQSCSNKKNICF